MSIIRAKKLAEILGVTTMTIHNYSNKGMPFIVIGKQKKYVLEQVQEWLNNGGEVTR